LETSSVLVKVKYLLKVQEQLLLKPLAVHAKA
jgi:hypothetical protein